MVSKDIEKSEMGVSVKSHSHHADVTVETTSTASTSWSVTDKRSHEILREEIASTSKEEVAVKQEDSEVFTKDPLPMKSNDSKFEVFLVTSSSESNSASELESEASSSIQSISPERQEDKEPHLELAFDLAATELEESLKEDESDVCMVDDKIKEDSDNATVLTSQLNANEIHLPKIPSEESISAAQETQSTFNIEDDKSHRQSKHYSSESSDYDSESSDSSDDEEYFTNMRKGREEPATQLRVLKTKGELLIQDLPPVEDLYVSVPPTELQKIGIVLHLITAQERNEFLVIVLSDGNSAALDNDSALFLASGEPLGKIHEVFGPVARPSYSIRFNKAEDISNKGVTRGQDVFYSPKNDDLTYFVLVDDLKKQKGSDASWKDNNEPPIEEIDYSDDEQEKIAKHKRKAKTRGKERDLDAEGEEDVAPKKMERRDAAFNQRVFKRASRNVFHSATPGPSRSPSGSCPPQRFGSAPPPSDNFGSSGLPRNAVSPQQLGPPPMNSVPFLQRNGPSPLPLVQFQRSNLQSPQPCEPVPLSSPQPFGQFPHSNAPAPLPFGQLPRSNVLPHPSFGSFPQSSVPPFQPFSAPNRASNLATGAPQLNPASLMAAPQSNVPLHQQMLLQSQQLIVTVSSPPPGYNQRSNLQSPQPCDPHPFRNSPSPQSFGPGPNSNVPSPQSFGQFLQSNVPAPLPFGQLPRSNVPSFQPFAGLSSPVQAPYLAAGSPQLSPASLMAAPQSNVSLHQQLQSQQLINTVPSHFPLSNNSNQNSRNFLRQHHTFTRPIFGTLPATTSTMQNASAHPPIRSQNPPSTVYFHTSPAPGTPTYSQNHRPF